MTAKTKQIGWQVAVAAASLMGASIANATWVASVTIDRIQVTDLGNVVVYITGDNGCGGTRLEYDSTKPAAKMVYAGLLAAQAQGRPMNFNVTSCPGGNVAIFQHIEG